MGTQRCAERAPRLLIASCGVLLAKRSTVLLIFPLLQMLLCVGRSRRGSLASGSPSPGAGSEVRLRLAILTGGFGIRSHHVRAPRRVLHVHTHGVVSMPHGPRR